MKQFKDNLTIIFILSMTIISTTVFGQITAATIDKYDTTNYPKDRKAIEAIKGIREDSMHFLNDDYIGVGAEGKAYYGYKDEIKSFIDNEVKFKSARRVPNTYFLRIYNGDAAIKNLALDIVMETPKGILSFRVLRVETFIKRKGKWYRMAGQGTLAMTKEEFEKAIEQFIKKN
ncbi:MAG: hypothetical protein ABI683_13505 [Ginsengibacter sp.]